MNLKGALTLKTLSRRILPVFVLAVVGGTLLHFVYELFPNPVCALFSPVCESLWEHLKILYWPFLLALLFLTRGGEKGCRAPWLLSLLVICGLMLGAGYFYHIGLGGDSMFFDIGLYVILMALGFLLPRLFWPLGKAGWWSGLLWVLTILLGAAILLFTTFPPRGLLFADLSAARTWVTIPY